jgi:hypothetical protein
MRMDASWNRYRFFRSVARVLSVLSDHVRQEWHHDVTREQQQDLEALFRSVGECIALCQRIAGADDRVVVAFPSPTTPTPPAVRVSPCMCGRHPHAEASPHACMCCPCTSYTASQPLYRPSNDTEPKPS